MLNLFLTVNLEHTLCCTYSWKILYKKSGRVVKRIQRINQANGTLKAFFETSEKLEAFRLSIPSTINCQFVKNLFLFSIFHVPEKSTKLSIHFFTYTRTNLALKFLESVHLVRVRICLLDK